MKKVCLAFTTVLFLLILNFCKQEGPPNSRPESPPKDSEAIFTWVSRSGGALCDSGCSIAVDSNDNVYAAGFFEQSASFGNISLGAYGGQCYDIFIAKYDNSGNPLWVRQAGSDDYDEGTAITIDNLDNVYVTGYFKGTAEFGDTVLNSYGERDIFTARYDPEGNLIWVKQAGSSDEDQGNSITTDHAGNVLVTGYFAGTAIFDGISITSNGISDIFFAKYDADGNLIWVTKAGSASLDQGLSISADNSDNFFVTGYFKETADFGGTLLTSYGDRDIFIAKYNADGNLLWVKQGGGIYWDYGDAITTDNSNNAYVTGSIAGEATFEGTSISSGSGLQIKVFIAKYNRDGNLLWVKYSGDSGSEWGKSIVVGNSGNIYLTGHFYIHTAFEDCSLRARGSYDIFIAKYDIDGKFKWAKSAGGDEASQGCGIAVGNDNSIYVTGAYSCKLLTAIFDDISLTSEFSDIFIGKLVDD